MKIGIYDPYLDTLGGGEKYIISIAKFFEENNQVDIFWNEDLAKNINDKFSIKLEKTKFRKNIFLNNSLINKYLTTKQYDLFFFISDGSIPFLFSKKNFLIFQFPPLNKKINFIDKIKLSRITKIICYSNFVKEHLDKIFNLSSSVLYPPVVGISGKLPKENIILSVGRFTKGINNKKQDFLIDSFRKLNSNKDWKFILAGSFLPEDEDFVNKIETLSKGLNIEVIKSPNNKRLSELYLKAKIYWHATGVGEDIDKYPERAEHFGISTVEAMSAGLVPIVINGGGQKEIVEDGVSGYLWNDQNELIKITEELIGDRVRLEKISKNAIKRSENFSVDVFNNKLNSLL